MVEIANNIWADFNPDGSPKEPYKPDIRAWGTFLETIANAGVTGGVRGYATKALMDADLVPVAGTVGLVISDPVATNNYPRVAFLKLGATGTGSWQIGMDVLSAYLTIQATHTSQIAALDSSTLDVRTNILFQMNIGLDDGTQMAYAFVDNNKLLGFGVGADGQMILGSDRALIGGSIKHIFSPDPDIIESWTDNLNQQAMTIHADGHVYIHKLELGMGGVGGGGSEELPDVLHIVWIGQSVDGEGSESLPVVTTTPTGHNAFMFVRGFRTWKLDTYANNPAARPASDFELTPLFEYQDGALGETAASGFAAALKETLLGRYNFRDRTQGVKILMSFAGRGGRFLRELMPAHPDPDGNYYATMVDDVRRAKQYCDQHNLTYAVGALVLTQGEANNGFVVDRAGSPLTPSVFFPTYKNDQISLFNSFIADVQLIQPGHGRFPMVTYQTLGTVTAYAQNLAADEHPDIYMAGPHYHLASAANAYYLNGALVQVHGSAVHLTADSSAAEGCNLGKVTGHVIGTEQREWNPVKITSAWKSAVNQVTVVIGGGEVATTGVFIETTFLNQATVGMGFEITDGAEVPAVIYNVTAVIKGRRPDELVLTTSANLGAGPYYIRHAAVRTAIPNIGIVNLWQDGPTLPNGQPSKELIITGDVVALTTKFTNEGVFEAQSGANIHYVRQVELSGANTIFRGETRDVTGTGFVVGQPVAINRLFPYGNIRDNDPTIPPMSYRDLTIGARTGKYKGWNWLRSELYVGIQLT